MKEMFAGDLEGQLIRAQQTMVSFIMKRETIGHSFFSFILLFSYKRTMKGKEDVTLRSFPRTAVNGQRSGDDCPQIKEHAIRALRNMKWHASVGSSLVTG